MGEQNTDRKDEKWGLVLSGGGAKGAYQIGVWKAMQEAGLCDRIAGISGASIGSLNAVLFAAGDLEKAQKAWKKVNLLTVFDTEWSMIDGIEGFALREGMLHLVKDYVDYEKVRTYPYEIFCSIARIITKEYYEGEYCNVQGVDRERLELVLAASSAMPVIYEAVQIDGAMYRDGGLCDNVPIRPLYEQGYRKIMVIGLDKAQKRHERKFPEAEFWSVYPSYSLGDIEGTLNFRQDFITFCRKLGYHDGKRWFAAYQNGQVDEEALAGQAKADYELIMAEIRREKLEKSVEGNMKKLGNIMERYGIEW